MKFDAVYEIDKDSPHFMTVIDQTNSLSHFLQDQHLSTNYCDWVFRAKTVEGIELAS